ncbi:MAG: hypothetical protein LBM01_00805 [Christensenellaceae bacterium]|jgi:hypothetical protein|nr:hypothetical protein [Christensenellaceae bacterium]
MRGSDVYYETHTPYISDLMSAKLRKFALNADFAKDEGAHKGGSAMFLPYDDEYAVLYSKIFTENRIKPEEYNQVIEEVHNLFMNGYKVAPILGYLYNAKGTGIPNPNYNGKVNRDYIFLQRAPGYNLSDLHGYHNFIDKKEAILNSPDTYFTELAETLNAILNSKINPDFNPGNIIYGKNAGFNFCDFNTLEEHKDETMKVAHIRQFLESFLIPSLSLRRPDKAERTFDFMGGKEKYFKTAKEEQKVITDKLSKIPKMRGMVDGAIKTSLPFNEFLQCESISDIYR